MRTLWLKIWLWTKAVAAALLLIYLLTFVAKNSGKPVDFWIWPNVEQLHTSVLMLSLYAFVAGVVGWIVLRAAIQTIRQVQELRQRSRQDRTEKQIADMHAKAASLHAKPVMGEDPSAPSGR